jgi:hypothetical protein
MNDSGRDVMNEREEQISKCLRNMATIRREKRKSRPDKGPSIGLEKAGTSSSNTTAKPLLM